MQDFRVSYDAVELFKSKHPSTFDPEILLQCISSSTGHLINSISMRSKFNSFYFTGPFQGSTQWMSVREPVSLVLRKIKTKTTTVQLGAVCKLICPVILYHLQLQLFSQTSLSAAILFSHNLTSILIHRREFVNTHS